MGALNHEECGVWVRVSVTTELDVAITGQHFVRSFFVAVTEIALRKEEALSERRIAQKLGILS